MIQQNTKQGVTALMLLFAAAYFTSYMTRSNYSAVLTAIISDTNHRRELLSLALTGSFFTYGLGQIVSGFFGDRFSPKKLLGLGLLLTACMNLLLPLCTTPWQMTVVWSINGFAQAFMWPPLLKLMTVLLPEKDYQKGVLWVSYGCNAATILLYLLGSVMVNSLGWRSMFILPAAVAAIMLAAWMRLCPDPGKVVHSSHADTALPDGKKMLFAPMMLAIMLAIVLHGILKDGVASWMPDYIKNTYHTGDSLAILSGVLMPIFSILSTKAGSVLYRRKFSNPVACAAFVFGISVLCAFGLALLEGKSAVMSITLMALLTGSMHAVNLMLISTIPPYFRKYGAVSTASGVLNACTYTGSAVSTYGIAILSDKKGWGFTLWLWMLIAACAAVLCLISMHAFKKKFQED